MSSGSRGAGRTLWPFRPLGALGSLSSLRSPRSLRSLRTLGSLRPNGALIPFDALGTDSATGPAAAIATNNASAPSGIPDPANIQLELLGLGLSQQAVSEFVLRLEEMTLFRQVKLIETRREPYLESEAIAFRIVCVFQTAEVSQP